MIIPVSPIPVRISLETQAINNGGYAVHDIDVNALIENANSVQYELQLCYGTTSLYRSAVYHVNKSYKTVAFFFMVGQDMFTATLSSASNRCTFAKMSSGISETQVQNMIHQEMSAGLGVCLPEVDATEGFTISLPDLASAVGQFCGGHILIVEGENAVSTNDKFISTDFWYAGASKGWQFMSAISGSAFSASDVTVSGTKTGVHIANRYFTDFNVYVIWYSNPDNCVVELGTYQPATDD